ncbi:MAG: lysophospholipid acyltransferase family protein, partial [Ktedonobacteraceae bacterium]
MTQQSGSTPASDHPEQPRQAQMVEQTNKPAKSHKPTKNLYEPYDTPMWFWVVFRTVARFIFFLKLRVHLIGLDNVPKQGAFIIASNHLSWMDVPLVPGYLKRKVVY